MSEVTWTELNEADQEEILLSGLNLNLKNSKAKTNTVSQKTTLKRVGWVTVGVFSTAFVIDSYFFYGKGTINLLFWITGLFL